MRELWFLWFLCFSTLLWAEDDFYRSQLEKRIEPVGKVRIESTSEKREGQTVVEQADEPSEKAAKDIYAQHCAVCHQSGVAGAPIYRNAAQWETRLKDGGLEKLTSAAIKGVNAMPAKGTCNSCSDDDIRKTIEYMLPQ